MDRNDVARKLADDHVNAEEEIVLAIQYVRTGGDQPDEPIKLLEVNRATIPAGVMPIYFGASKGYPPVVIIEVTEDEYREVEGGALVLPDGWDQAIVLHKRAA